MQDLEIIYLIRDELLTYPNLSAEDVYLVANIAQNDLVMYSLMSKWMEETSEVEKDYLFHDMLHRRDILNSNVIPFRRCK